MNRENSLSKLEAKVSKLDMELTPCTESERCQLLEVLFIKLSVKISELSPETRMQCQKYMRGEVTMRELSKYFF